MSNVGLTTTTHGTKLNPRADQMSLLDYFAARALQGLLEKEGCEKGLEALLVQRAYHIADLMLRER